jgi:hypothetical protein
MNKTFNKYKNQTLTILPANYQETFIIQGKVTVVVTKYISLSISCSLRMR